VKRLLICWANRQVEPCEVCEERASAMVESGEALLFAAQAHGDRLRNLSLRHIYQLIRFRQEPRSVWVEPICFQLVDDYIKQGGLWLDASFDSWLRWASSSEERRLALDEAALIAALNGGVVP